MTTYREQLRIPLIWWLLAALFAVSIGWVFLVVTTWAIAIIATLIVAVPLAWALWTYGSLTLDVTDGTLRVGRTQLEERFRGPAQALSAQGFRHAMGPGADARAFILVRPYVKTGALIPVADSGDATPYWLLSTRHPENFVASLTYSGKDRPHNEPTNAEPIGEKTIVEED
ncbi:MAG: DUF3093 domain-containing protein [Kineosporiaceae bacterium]|nr:DUF3093 domain-containing protein [Aeromicrobium sp.]